MCQFAYSYTATGRTGEGNAICDWAVRLVTLNYKIPRYSLCGIKYQDLKACHIIKQIEMHWVQPRLGDMSDIGYKLA